jgi:hypothetical protein
VGRLNEVRHPGVLAQHLTAQQRRQRLLLAVAHGVLEGGHALHHTVSQVLKGLRVDRLEGLHGLRGGQLAVADRGDDLEGLGDALGVLGPGGKVGRRGLPGLLEGREQTRVGVLGGLVEQNKLLKQN